MFKCIATLQELMNARYRSKYWNFSVPCLSTCKSYISPWGMLLSLLACTRKLFNLTLIWWKEIIWLDLLSLLQVFDNHWSFVKFEFTLRFSVKIVVSKTPIHRLSSKQSRGPFIHSNSWWTLGTMKLEVGTSLSFTRLAWCFLYAKYSA